MKTDLKAMAKEITDNVISEEFILAALEPVEAYIKMTDTLLSQHQSRKAFLASAVNLEEYKDMPVKLLRKYTRKIENARFLVNCVEDALDDPEVEEYVKMIDLLYFQRKTYSQMADELFCNARTVSRWKEKALKILAVFIFGVDALGLDGAE